MAAESPRGAPRAARRSFAGGIEIMVTLLNNMGSVFILFLMVLIVADVIGREAFKSPIAGVPEMVKLSMAGIVFLQLAQCFRAGRIARVDGLLGFISRRWPALGAALRIVFGALGVALFVVLLNGIAGQLTTAIEDALYIGTPGIFTFPVWPLDLMIAVGCGAVILVLLRDLNAEVRSLVKGIW